jgi:hypothetical protein
VKQSVPAERGVATATPSLHPSWVAAKKNKENKSGLMHIDVSSTSAKKIKFDD